MDLGECMIECMIELTNGNEQPEIEEGGDGKQRERTKHFLAFRSLELALLH